MRFLGVAAALVYFFIIVGPVQAQTLPSTTSDDQMGMQPYQSYHGGDIDVVSLSTGTLNVNLPFLSYPQRGKLHLSFNLFYNNQWQHRGEECPLHSTCMWIWGYPLPESTLPIERSDMFVGSAQQFDVTGSDIPVSFYGGGGRLLYTIYYANWWLQTADGSKHVLGNMGTLTETGSSPNFFEQGSGPWETLDATGWRVNGAFTAGGETWVPGTPTSILDADGTYYDTATAFEEDPNGNKITQSGGITTDSLGRQIPSPPNASSSSNTSTSACPQGLLPVDHAVLWSVPGPSGATEPYTFCYVIVTVNIPPGSNSNVFPGAFASQTKLQSIVLPNGQSWSFQYNDPGDGSTYNGSPINYGTLTQIALPTGGTLGYTYTTINNSLAACQNDGRWVATRTLNANDGTGSHTSTYAYSFNPGPYLSSTNVTDPLGNYAVHTFSNFGQCALFETQTQNYQSGGTLLKTVTTMYGYAVSRNAQWGPVNVVPTQVTTAWPNGKTSQTTKSYDAGYNYIDYQGHSTNVNNTANIGIYGKVLSESDYDYGQGAAGALLRTTNTSYQAFQNSNYLTNNLLNLPYSVQVNDSGGTQRAYTTYGYDEYSLNSSGITTQHDSAPPDGTARGNQTSVHRWLNGSTVATTDCNIAVSNGYLVNYNTYNDTGTVNKSVDSCGSSATDATHMTTYAYSTTYVGAYPTTITNPKSQQTSHTYDFNTGLLMSTTDPNSQTTSFTYDNMWRLVSASYPDGGLDTITRQEITPPFSATLTKRVTNSVNYVTTNIFDGLGRISQNQVADTQGTIYSDTTYDADGRKASVSNPYRTTGDATYGVTSYVYDGIGRTCVVVPPDGTASGPTCPTTQPSNDIFTTYLGNTTTVTDQQVKSRTSQTDGLGRLTNVWEDPGGLNYQTVYTYSALDDLASVAQGSSRNRSFVFDSLKHMTSSTNPEAGTVTYSYDADSNVITKADARSITITYSYDNLNRMTGRTYSNGDPSVSYTYDQATCLAGETTCYNVGRRTSMTDAGGSESWSYDKMGREWGEQRTTNSITKTTSYQYNFDGSLFSLTYPSGRTVTYTTDPVRRPSEAQDVANGINYALGWCNNGQSNQAACYAPQGALSGLVLGQTSSFGGITLSDTYNKRLQPNEFKASSTAGTAMDLTYSFVDASSHNNGNVMGITNNRDTTRSQSFSYDSLNRIATAKTSSTSGSNCWGETYTIDQWANLTSIGAVSGYTGCTQEGLSVTATTNNQLSATGFSYDAAGNMLGDSVNTYGWNAESEIKSAAGVNYTYDGDGNRVQKSNGKIYWYGAGTEILDESDASGNITDEYVFFGGKRVAHRVVSSGSISYYAEDFLGSSRAITTSAGTLCYDADFYPYGGERVVTNTCAQNYKFEGKERDTETGNDDFGARYYTSRLGRWLSADWSSAPTPVPYANLANPQTLNLYAMVHDNPETFADLDGHYELNGSNCNGNAKCQKKWNKAADKFEKQREKDLNSKKSSVRAAAANFGGRGEANGVHVGFADLSSQHIDGSVAASGSAGGMKLIQVTLDFGRAGDAETQTHEGTHIGDDTKFLNSYNPLTGGYNQALNLTHFQTEFNAFKAGAEVNHEHGFGPNDTQKITDYIRANYPARILNLPVFDPSTFPAGGTTNEQQ
jgi:RHS repeat-associated protein